MTTKPKRENFFTTLGFRLFKFVRWLIGAICTGVVAGGIVTFLFSTPVLSVKDSTLIHGQDEVVAELTIHNTGRSEANKVRIERTRITISNNNVVLDMPETKGIEKIEVGGIYTYRARELPKQDGPAYLIFLIRYEDNFRFRQWIRERLGHDYAFEVWASYESGKHKLSAMSPSIRKRIQQRLKVVRSSPY